MVQTVQCSHGLQPSRTNKVLSVHNCLFPIQKKQGSPSECRSVWRITRKGTRILDVKSRCVLIKKKKVRMRVPGHIRVKGTSGHRKITSSISGAPTPRNSRCCRKLKFAIVQRGESRCFLLAFLLPLPKTHKFSSLFFLKINPTRFEGTQGPQ
jgi:hypothetical protein